MKLFNTNTNQYHTVLGVGRWTDKVVSVRYTRLDMVVLKYFRDKKLKHFRKKRPFQNHETDHRY